MASIELSIIDMINTGAGVTVGAIPTTPFGGPPLHLWERSGGRVTAHATVLTHPALAVDAVEIVVTFTVPAALTSDYSVRALSNNSDLRLDAAEIPAGTVGSITLTWTPRMSGRIGSGVHRADWNWQWQFRIDGGIWEALETTWHTGFVLLDEPADPWSLDGARGTTPWFEVLDLACDWAWRQNTREAVRSSLSNGLYRLGGRTIVKPSVTYVIEYDPGKSSNFVTGHQFIVDEFVDLALTRSRSAYWTFNCLDAAAAVAALSSAIGCPTGIVTLCPPKAAGSFPTHPVQGAGLSTFIAYNFMLHAVAADPATGVATRIWDACLVMDLDADPAVRPPATYGLALGLAAGTGGYNRQLTAAGVITNASQAVSLFGSGAAPVPIDTCYASAPPMPAMHEWSPDAIRKALDLEAWLEAHALSYQRGTVTIGTADFRRHLAVVVLPQPVGHVLIEAWEATTPEHASLRLADLLRTCPGRPIPTSGLGDRAFVPEYSREALLIVGHVVVRVGWSSPFDTALDEIRHALVFLTPPSTAPAASQDSR